MNRNLSNCEIARKKVLGGLINGNGGGGLLPRGLINGMKKMIRNDKMIKTYSSIKKCFPFTGL